MRPPRPSIASSASSALRRSLGESSRSGRVALALGVLAILGFAAEALHPGHHVHGGDEARHHHHFFLGAHSHGEHDEPSHTHGGEAHAHDEHETPSDDPEPSTDLLIDAFVLDEPVSPLVLAVALRVNGRATAVHPVDGPVSTARRPGGARAPPVVSRV